MSLQDKLAQWTKRMMELDSRWEELNKKPQDAAIFKEKLDILCEMNAINTEMQTYGDDEKGTITERGNPDNQ